MLREPLSIQLRAPNVWAALKWSNGVKDRRASRPRGQPRSSSSDENHEGKKEHRQSPAGFPFAFTCSNYVVGVTG